MQSSFNNGLNNGSPIMQQGFPVQSQGSPALGMGNQWGQKNQVYNNQGILMQNQGLGGSPMLNQGFNPLAHVETGAPIMVNKKLRSTGNLHTAPGTHGAGLYGHLQQNQQQQWSQTQQWGQGQSFVQPLATETFVRPALVEQTQRSERFVEVQPIIHRQVEVPEVHVIEQHIYESAVPSGNNVHTRAPIVQETVVPRIIEEIQPILHREVATPFIEVVEQHTTEHIVQPTITTRQVINEGSSPMLHSGLPLQQQSSMQQTGFPLGQQGLQSGAAAPQKQGLLSKLHKSKSQERL